MREGFTRQTSHAPSGKHTFFPAVPAIRKTRIPTRHSLTVVRFLWGQASATTQDVRLKLDTALLLSREDVDGARQSKGTNLVYPDMPNSADRGGHAAVRLSPATQKSRTKVLDIVLTSLRRTGDRSPPPESAVVELVLQGGSVADFAASLALLLECGQQEEQVISAGTAFLAENSSSKTAPKAHPEALPDVPLCMAIAHHRLALAALEAASIFPHLGAAMQGSGAADDKSPRPAEGSSSPVARAYGNICSALKLLKECGGGKTMAGAADGVSDLLCEPALDHIGLQRQLLDLLLVSLMGLFSTGTYAAIKSGGFLR